MAAPQWFLLGLKSQKGESLHTHQQPTITPPAEISGIILRKNAEITVFFLRKFADIKKKELLLSRKNE